MRAGFLSPADFARKIGNSYATVIGWTLTAKIPFQAEANGRKWIPEAEAMETQVVKSWLARKETVAQTPSQVPPTVVKEVPICSEEKLFLVARQKAAHYINRAKNCRDARRPQAEAEMLWLAVEQFGFKIE